MGLLDRLFGARLEEGQAPGGSPPVVIAAAEVDRAAPPGRRDRVLLAGQDVLADVTAQKILHGWLQNQHQTMFPLTVNMRVLAPAQRALLVRWMAVALLAAAADLPGRAEAARRWLGTVGAAAPVIAALDAALADPPPLSATLADIAGQGLSAYSYVAALIALDSHDAAAMPFLDYVAARLALPTPVIRSAVRRYRA